MTSTSASNEADIILNRTNVALARSQRLIQSWLPAPSTATTPTTQSYAEPDYNDEEDDGDALHDLAGLGSKRKANDEGLPDGAFKRNKLSSNDKLLEQLLGKKAMQARRKKLEVQQQQKGVIERGRQGEDGLKGQSGLGARKRGNEAVEEDDEDEEGGRATAFKSRRREPVKVLHAKETSEADHVDAKERDGEGGDAAVVRICKTLADEDNDEVSKVHQEVKPETARPAKKKAGSYLDELLAQKAAKKSKKKKKNVERANDAAIHS